MSGRNCNCGCGDNIPSSKRYKDKEHQLRHLRSGEAARMNAMQPPEAKRRGGRAAGRAAVASGQLALAGRKGADRIAQIARLLRESA
jgi:hypothetical protein